MSRRQTALFGHPLPLFGPQSPLSSNQLSKLRKPPGRRGLTGLSRAAIGLENAAGGGGGNGGGNA
jgi:hypothetical protein